MNNHAQKNMKISEIKFLLSKIKKNTQEINTLMIGGNNDELEILSLNESKKDMFHEKYDLSEGDYIQSVETDIF